MPPFLCCRGTFIVKDFRLYAQLFNYDFGVRLIKPDPNIYYRTDFLRLSHFVQDFLGKFVKVFRNTLLEDAAFGAGEDGHHFAFFSQ